MSTSAEKMTPWDQNQQQRKSLFDKKPESFPPRMQLELNEKPQEGTQPNEHKTNFNPNWFLKGSDNDFQCGIVGKDGNIIDVDVNSFTCNSGNIERGMNVPLLESLNKRVEGKEILDKEMHAHKNSLIEPSEGINSLYSRPACFLNEEFICAKEEETVLIKFDPMLLEYNTQGSQLATYANSVSNDKLK